MTDQWRSLSLANPPTESGIYAIKTESRWLYIGRSANIARRIANKKHPVQITKNLASLTLFYQWQPISQHLASAEHALIRAHRPEWNGGTSFSGIGQHGPSCDIPLPMTAANQLVLLAAIEPGGTS